MSHIDKDTAAIVVVTFNRLVSLKRLIGSLLLSEYDRPVKLYISIDYSSFQSDIIEYCENLTWPHGELEIIARNKNLGLKNHILACGELSLDHDYLIMLEDDLFVSPQYFKYANSAVNYYRNENTIAGISLYSPRLNETSLLRFRPIFTDADCYFIQLPCSWGQVWTKDMWLAFSAWCKTSNLGRSFFDLPPNIERWSSKSWKKIFAAYMVSKGKYFVYPYFSLSTNYGVTGTHMKENSRFQVPLALTGESPWRFQPLFESNTRYDAYLELEAECVKRLNPSLNNINFIVNLEGYKDVSPNDTQLTTWKPDDVIMSFSDLMEPKISNVLFGVEGNGIYLGRVNTPKHCMLCRIKQFISSYQIPLTLGLLSRLFRR